MVNNIYSENITVAASGTDSTIFCTQGEFSVIGAYIPASFDTGDITFKTSMDDPRTAAGAVNTTPTMAAVLDESGNPVELVAGTAARWYNLPPMLQGTFLQLICPTQSAERTITLVARRIS